jgi:hypothetical protein
MDGEAELLKALLWNKWSTAYCTWKWYWVFIEKERSGGHNIGLIFFLKKQQYIYMLYFSSLFFSLSVIQKKKKTIC